jgi:hypothetical protein
MKNVIPGSVKGIIRTSCKRLIVKTTACVSFFIIPSFVLAADRGLPDNLCPDAGIYYCRNVGRSAYPGYGSPAGLKGVRLGKIIGVAWKKKGSRIGQGRTSPRNAYYYIIDSGAEDPFLKQCRDVNVKE